MKQLAFFFLILVSTVVSVVAQGSAVASKRLNFAYTYGNPDYVDLSSLGKNVFPAGIDNQMVKARNLKSFAVNFRGWRLLDEYIVDPEFFWELDPIALKGKIRIVNYEKISKYPSLAKRYKAIKPTGVNYVVCVDLNSTDQDGDAAASGFRPHQVCFRAQSYQMFWGGSRSGRAASYPGALLGWREGVSTASAATRFTASDNSDVNRLKNIVSKFRNVSKYSGLANNTWLDIRWPDDAIDKIYDDFEEYEKEGKDLEKEYKEAKEEPKIAKRAQPLTADDEMAQPFEDAPKTAKVFSEIGAMGLVTPKGKKVFSSDKYGWASALDDKGRFFQFHLKGAPENTNNKQILNAAGKVMTFDGHSAIAWIDRSEDGSGYAIYIDNGGSDVYRTAKCFASPRESFSADEFRMIQAWDQDGQRPARGHAGYISFSPHWRVFKTALRVSVDSNFKKLASGTGYITSSKVGSKYGDYLYDWPFKWK